MLTKILAGLGIFALLIAGLIFFVWNLTSEPVKVIHAHLDAINQGDYSRAYSYLSSTLKATQSLEDFRSFVERYPVLKTSGAAFHSRSISNQVATIRGKLTGKNGDVVTVRYRLVKERGHWVIEAVRLGGGDDEP